MINQYWNTFNVITREHFYHNGGSIDNRHSMTEALVFNFDLKKPVVSMPKYQQQELFAYV